MSLAGRVIETYLIWTIRQRKRLEVTKNHHVTIFPRRFGTKLLTFACSR